MQIMEIPHSSGQDIAANPPFAVLGHWTLAHGLAVAVSLPESAEEIPEEALARLHPEERAWALTQAPRRRMTWVGGRLALRQALELLGVTAGPIFATERGAPLLPAGVAGSVTHKAGARAVALVQVDPHWRLGVDLELLAPARPGIARKVLTEAEQERLSSLPQDRYWREVITRFSMKEAIYKAIDRFVGRYVDFKEVEIDPQPDSSAIARLLLRAGEGPFLVETWSRVDDLDQVLSTARVRLE
jgi:enterobactin synthetase component D